MTQDTPAATGRTIEHPQDSERIADHGRSGRIRCGACGGAHRADACPRYSERERKLLAAGARSFAREARLGPGAAELCWEFDLRLCVGDAFEEAVASGDVAPPAGVDDTPGAGPRCVACGAEDHDTAACPHYDDGARAAMAFGATLLADRIGGWYARHWCAQLRRELGADTDAGGAPTSPDAD